MKFPTYRAALLAAALLSPSLAARTADAQQSPGYFVPPQNQSRPAPAARPQRPPPAAVMPPAAPQAPQAEAEAPPPPPPPATLPPPPDIPALPRGTAPPAAVIGVLGIPDVMRASTAAQQIEKVIGERREKLNQDAQKEQAAWRDMQQSLAGQRTGQSADQIRGRERELQERISKAQKEFRDRNRIIQEAGQYGLAQIERVLIGVIRQVSESRGMNLVLHRQQVALNVNEFDITEQVTQQLNKVLPSVLLPPEGVEPSSFKPPGAAAEKPAESKPVAPASAPASAAPKK